MDDLGIIQRQAPAKPGHDERATAVLLQTSRVHTAPLDAYHPWCMALAIRFDNIQKGADPCLNSRMGGMRIDLQKTERLGLQFVPQPMLDNRVRAAREAREIADVTVPPASSIFNGGYCLLRVMPYGVFIRRTCGFQRIRGNDREPARRNLAGNGKVHFGRVRRIGPANENHSQAIVLNASSTALR
jgi:hypothetical protein